MNQYKENIPYVECHAHTEYSNLRLRDSTLKVKKLILEAKERGLKGVAITDHECLSGHIKALTVLQDIRKGDEKKGILPDSEFKVILGNEIYLVDSKESVEGIKKKYYHFILLAKDKIGYDIIRELSSQAWMNVFKTGKMERVPLLKSELVRIIGDRKGHIIGSTACLGSEFSQLMLEFIENETKENKDRLKNFVNFCLEVFGKDDFFIELQCARSEEQDKYNARAISFAKAFGLKYIITNDIHYLDDYRREFHKSFLNSAEGDREVDDFYKYTYMKTPTEIFDILGETLSLEDIREGIDNTMLIYDKIEDFTMFQDVEVPEIELDESTVSLHLFKDYYGKYRGLREFANSPYVQDRGCLRFIEEGFLKKKVKLTNRIVERINEELETLWDVSEDINQRVSSYYNLVKRIVEIMWDDDKGNSLVGIARGSVTGFYSAYLMEITQISPLAHDLCAWRHLHKSRPELPSINWALVVNLAKGCVA